MLWIRNYFNRIRIWIYFSIGFGSGSGSCFGSYIFLRNCQILSVFQGSFTSLCIRNCLDQDPIRNYIFRIRIRIQYSSIADLNQYMFWTRPDTWFLGFLASKNSIPKISALQLAVCVSDDGSWRVSGGCNCVCVRWELGSSAHRVPISTCLTGSIQRFSPLTFERRERNLEYTLFDTLWLGWRMSGWACNCACLEWSSSFPLRSDQILLMSLQCT